MSLTIDLVGIWQGHFLTGLFWAIQGPALPVRSAPGYRHALVSLRDRLTGI